MKTIIEMAREAGFMDASHPFNPWSAHTEQIERFAELVRADERLEAEAVKRLWVGLTDEEIIAMRHLRDWTAGWTDITYTRAIEAKLKEKNT